MTLTPVTIAFLSFGVMLCSYFCHEIGHVFMAWRLKKESRMVLQWYSVEMDFATDGLTNEEVKSVYYAGIIGGIFPLFVFFLLPYPSLSIFLFLAGLLLHLHTAIYDIRQVRKLPGDDCDAVLCFMTPLGMALVLFAIFVLSVFVVSA